MATSGSEKLDALYHSWVAGDISQQSYLEQRRQLLEQLIDEFPDIVIECDSTRPMILPHPPKTAAGEAADKCRRRPTTRNLLIGAGLLVLLLLLGLVMAKHYWL